MRFSANSLKAGGIIDLWFDSVPDLLRRIHPRDLLDSEELHRAERLRCDKNRARFIGRQIFFRPAASSGGKSCSVRLFLLRSATSSTPLCGATTMAVMGTRLQRGNCRVSSSAF